MSFKTFFESWQTARPSPPPCYHSRMPSPVRRQPANTRMKSRALVVVIGLLCVGLISAFNFRLRVHLAGM